MDKSVLIAVVFISVVAVAISVSRKKTVNRYSTMNAKAGLKK
jgi:hypothetical protein